MQEIVKFLMVIAIAAIERGCKTPVPQAFGEGCEGTAY
jgi:hypothetical protein